MGESLYSFGWHSSWCTWRCFKPSRKVIVVGLQGMLSGRCYKLGLESFGYDTKNANPSKAHSLRLARAIYWTWSSLIASPVAVRMIVQIHWRRSRQEIQSLVESADGNPLAAALVNIFLNRMPKSCWRMEENSTVKHLLWVAQRRNPNGKWQFHHDKDLQNSCETRSDQCNSRRNQTLPSWLLGCLDLAPFKWLWALDTRDIRVGASPDIRSFGNDGYRLFWLLPPLYFDSYYLVHKEESTKVWFWAARDSNSLCGKGRLDVLGFLVQWTTMS